MRPNSDGWFKFMAENYKNICNSLTGIGNMMEEILCMAKNNKHGFTCRRFCSDFDILLQHSLLSIAAADGTATLTEIASTDALTNFGDLLRLSENELGTSLAWEELSAMPADEIIKWLEELRAPVRKATAEFCAAFAAIDVSGLSPQYYDQFKQELTAFMAAFAHMDDDTLTPAETQAIAKSELTYALACIKNFIDSYSK